ncbi:MAG TPA: hypothetical protein VI895_08570 [Bdellovibrionota bacterium]|nr:hypothetical protein [Bdellovibrionota bacterium]
MGLAEAVRHVIELIRGRPRVGSNKLDNWDRIVCIVAEHDSLPDREFKIIENAVGEACRSWSDAPRLSIWRETESGMADAESSQQTSADGIEPFLQTEILDEVTHAAWRDARELRREKAKKSRRRQASP